MHRLVVLSALLLSALTLPACAQAPAASEAPAVTAAADKGVQRASATPIKPLAQKKFGADITEKTSTPLDALLHKPGQFAQKTVRTEGVVSAVCKSMGCWMEIADDSGHAHIKMAGHSFFVPKDSTGHHAVIQGKVLAPVAEAKDDCTQEAEQAMGSVAKVEIEATGVEFVD